MQEGRSMDWRLFATKPKGGYRRKPAVQNDLTGGIENYQEGLNNDGIFKRDEGEAVLREQKTDKAGCPSEGKLETEDNKGERSIVTPESTEKNGAGSYKNKYLVSIGYDDISVRYEELHLSH
jgi:hypothetical protein